MIKLQIRVAVFLVIQILPSFVLHATDQTSEANLPKNLKTVNFQKTVNVTQPDKIVEVDLGVLLTAIDYKIVIPLANNSSSVLELKTISSSCGCIVGIQKDLPIPVGKTAQIALIIPRGQRAGEFKKLVKLIDADGQAWPLGIRARFSSMFNVSPSKISIDSSDIVLSIKPSDAELDMSQFEVESLTGFLVFIENSRVNTDDNALQINASLAHGVKRSLTTLIERIVLRDRLDPLNSFEISMPIESSRRVGLKPDSVRLKFAGGKFSGSAILLGEKERLGSFQSGILAFPDREIVGQLTVLGRATSVIQVEIAFHEHVDSLGDFTELSDGVIFDQDGAKLCEVKRVHFLRTKEKEDKNE